MVLTLLQGSSQLSSYNQYCDFWLNTSKHRKKTYSHCFCMWERGLASCLTAKCNCKEESLFNHKYPIVLCHLKSFNQEYVKF